MTNDKTEKVKRMKQAGLFAKGTVYILAGGLSALAAMNWGGETSGKSGARNFISDLPGGKVLLILFGIGLLCYCFWRYFQAISNPGDKKNAQRAGYLFSGTVYLFIAYSFVKPVFGGGSGGDGDEKKKQMLARVLEWPGGIYIVGLIALIVLIVAIVQFKRAYQGKFMTKLDEHPDKRKEHQLIYRTGVAGYISRGVVFLIFSYFLVRVAMDHNANEFQGTKGVFHYIASLSYGQYLLLAVTLGLVCYGLFNLLVARHTSLSKIS